MLMTKSNRFFQQSRGCNSKCNDRIWPVFKLVQEFIHVHLICKFQDEPNKTDWVMLMTKSNRGFFSNQVDVTLRFMIRSGYFSNLFEISSMSTLSVSFRKTWSKLNEFRWWQSQRLFQQLREHNSKFNDPIWWGFKLVWDFIHVHLICKFQEHSIKTEWVTLMTVKQRLLQQSRGHNAKSNVPIWPAFKLVRDFTHVHLICKFQEDPIKTIAGLHPISGSNLWILTKLTHIYCWDMDKNGFEFGGLDPFFKVINCW